ncbi:hypothetical protein Taro_021371 [Colocasia esculenta]|uniref:Uncharacterized protein n=1 Tax=Colocasia esculenta TaxID=4460 RepID=A0A843V2A3_COLES|nr:hypothetical protein [Colocasia esculenta]
MAGERPYKSAATSCSRLRTVSSHLHCPIPAMASSEKEAALAAVPSDAPTVFDKILNKEIPSTVVYEDDKDSFVKAGRKEKINSN